LRNGEEIVGGYMNGNVSGSVEGKIIDGVLECTWREGAAEGHGKIETSGDKLSGAFGRGEEDKGAGTWKGARVKR
jgi:hypothetical protein